MSIVVRRQGGGIPQGLSTSYVVLFSHSIVEYSTPEEAQRAIKDLSDTPLLGRPVFIREVRPIVMKATWRRLRTFPDV